MLERLGLIGVLAAALGLTLVACGEGAGTTTCTSNTDCQTGEICHPSVQVCVKTCSSSADCPTEAKTCKTTTATGTQMICTCSTDELCARELGPGTVCSDRSEVCAPSQDVSCSSSSTTLGTAGGPDVCNYGEFCSGTTCTAAPEGTCSQATAAGAPTWSKTAKQAPVITSATAVFKSTTNSTTQCGGGVSAAEVTIQYYAPNGLTTHTTFADLQNHVKFRTATDFFGANYGVNDPPAGATFGQLTVGIACGSSSRTAAVYLMDESGNTSNVVCVSW